MTKRKVTIYISDEAVNMVKANIDKLLLDTGIEVKVPQYIGSLVERWAKNEHGS